MVPNHVIKPEITWGQLGIVQGKHLLLLEKDFFSSLPAFVSALSAG